MDFSKLQNLVKKDPDSYLEEFTGQWKHFCLGLELFNSSAEMHDSEEFERTILFLAHCVPLFTKKLSEVSTFSSAIVELLSSHSLKLGPSTRMACSSALFIFMKKSASSASLAKTLPC